MRTKGPIEPRLTALEKLAHDQWFQFTARMSSLESSQAALIERVSRLEKAQPALTRADMAMKNDPWGKLFEPAQSENRRLLVENEQLVRQCADLKHENFRLKQRLRDIAVKAEGN